MDSLSGQNKFQSYDDELIMNKRLVFIIPCLLISLIGCYSKNGDLPTSQSGTSADNKSSLTAANTVELFELDAEVIRFVLAKSDDHPNDRIYFLTTTPMEDWTDNGGWSRLPDYFHASLGSLKTKYRPADGACLREHHVLERGTDNPAWMQWVTIKKWESDTMVTVEEGVWCCPLGGGARTITYEKIDETWQIKELGPSWISSVLHQNMRSPYVLPSANVGVQQIANTEHLDLRRESLLR